MSEFSSINTPSDLVEFNNKPTEQPEKVMTQEVEKILDLVYQEDPESGLFIVNHILENLAEYHRDVIKQYEEKNEARNAAVWAYDLSVIQHSITSLNDVAL